MISHDCLPSIYPFHLRKAVLEDIPTVQALIGLSVRALHPPFYSPNVIDKALEQLTAIDSIHVNEGNYFIVETASSSASHSPPNSTLIIGCGGWSHRKTLHGSSDDTSRNPELLDPSTDPAKIRAMFVHPDWTEKGVASMLMKACEGAAQEAGFQTIELRASLQAVQFYERKGYTRVKKVNRELGDGEVLELEMMKRSLV